MAGQSPEYWPYPVAEPEEQNSLHKAIIQFMEEAYREDFKPCKYMEGEFYLEARNGRSAWLYYRGRPGNTLQTRWDLQFYDEQHRVLTMWVDDFPWAAAAALAWLRSSSVPDVLAIVEGHIIREPGVAEPAVVSNE